MDVGTSIDRKPGTLDTIRRNDHSEHGPYSETTLYTCISKQDNIEESEKCWEVNWMDVAPDYSRGGK